MTLRDIWREDHFEEEEPMNVQISLLKAVAIVALIAGIFSPLYVSSTATILGLQASVFLQAVSNAGAGIGLLIARQNDHSDEMAGAGVKPPLPPPKT